MTDFDKFCKYLLKALEREEIRQKMRDRLFEGEAPVSAGGTADEFSAHLDSLKRLWEENLSTSIFPDKPNGLSLWY